MRNLAESGFGGQLMSKSQVEQPISVERVAEAIEHLA
jgi:hypothetical protein